jgi:hypothetical protein
MTGNSKLQAASKTASMTLFAMFATMPNSPPVFGLGNGLHVSFGSSILAKITAKLSSSSLFCLTLCVGTTARSVILGMYRPGAETMLSSQLGVGLTQLEKAGQRSGIIPGVIVGCWWKKEVARRGISEVVVILTL